MGKNQLLLIGGIVAAVYFLGKNVSSTGNEGVGGGFSSITQMPEYGSPGMPAYDITGDAAKAASLVKLPLVGSMDGMPSASRIAAIEKESKANKSSGKVLYYPDVGIVTKSGLGYSTATPERYTSPTQTILSTTQTKNAVSQGAVFTPTIQPTSTYVKPATTQKSSLLVKTLSAVMKKATFT